MIAAMLRGVKLPIMTVTRADIVFEKRGQVRRCCSGRITFPALAEFIGRPARFLSMP
jgi:hypothetical protein